MDVWRSMKNRKTSEDLRKLVEDEHITAVFTSGKMRKYGHVMRQMMKTG